MAIDDNTVYGLTGAQIKELPGKIEAVKGLARVLTTDDYNWPANNPTGVALWLLDAGFYKGDGSVTVYPGSYSGGRRTNDASSYLIMKLRGGSTGILCSSNSNRISLAVTTREGGIDYNINNLLTEGVVMDNLTSSFTQFPLSARQGKILKDLVDSLAIRGAGAPTTATVGQVGTLYEDTTNGDLYICTDATNPYVWEEVGGAGITPVQTTGTSTTDVMSQNAVTGMVYADPATKTKIRIGGGTVGSVTDPVAIGRAASVKGNYAVAIGSTAGSQVTNAPGGISLGAFSSAAGRGQMDISLATATQETQNTCGYNGSAYRLLTGLYDPQNAHDAANKQYVDTQIGAIDTALQTLLNGGES